MNRSEMLERLTIAMTCHLPMPECKACKGFLGEIYDAIKDSKAEADRQRRHLDGPAVPGEKALYVTVEYGTVDGQGLTKVEVKGYRVQLSRPLIGNRDMFKLVPIIASPNQPSGAEEGSQHKPTLGEVIREELNRG